MEKNSEGKKRKSQSQRAAERAALIQQRRNHTNGVDTILNHLSKPDPLPVSKKIKEVQPETIQALPVGTLREYSMSRQDQEDAIFLKRLEDANRSGATPIHNLPPMRSVLSYIAQLKDEDQPMWFKSHQTAIVNSQYLNFPKMDVLTREYLQDHMRQPMATERPCGRLECESERLGQFRCRELIIPSETDVSPHPGWCVMCHFYETNKRYAENLSRKKDKDPHELMQRIHSFIVPVDVIGEYQLNRTLMGDIECIGIYGPFPVYNCNAYVRAELPNGLKCWKESDDMVFRLSRTA